MNVMLNKEKQPLIYSKEIEQRWKDLKNLQKCEYGNKKDYVR